MVPGKLSVPVCPAYLDNSRAMVAVSAVDAVGAIILTLFSPLSFLSLLSPSHSEP